MARLSVTSLTDSLDLLDCYDSVKAEKIAADENQVDFYEDKLGTYLVKLTGQPMSE